MSKLTLELVPPNGPSISLLDRINKPEYVEFEAIVLDDQGDEPIESAVIDSSANPVRLRGFFQPMERLDSLNGTCLSGTWTLRIIDNHPRSPRSGGTLGAWHILARFDKPRVVGDSNRDGVFDSRDLVSVFIAGEYEDDVPNNSTFEEGDWNGDGDFTTADLVFAFQAGTYVTLAIPQDHLEIAAAVDLIFASDDDLKRPPAFVA